MAEDYYSILGVPKTASPKAYLRLAREQHPDRFRDPDKRDQAEQRFQLVNESFNHLRDEKLRREDDKSLERKVMPPEQEAEVLYKNGLLQEQSREYNAARPHPGDGPFQAASSRGAFRAGDDERAQSSRGLHRARAALRTLRYGNQGLPNI
jgi:curved DNA-binding protein CbpA